MATEYYVVCEEAKEIIQLGKLHNHFISPDAVVVPQEEILEYMKLVTKKELSPIDIGVDHFFLTTLISFLSKHSGKVIHLFNDDQIIDWWRSKYGEEPMPCGFSRMFTTEQGWTVYT